MKVLHEDIKKVVRSAHNLEEMEQMVTAILDNLDREMQLAFVAGPISAKTSFGKMWNRQKLDILTKKIAKKIAPEHVLAFSCAITPRHLEKFSAVNFYEMYDRISDKGERLYLTGAWRKSPGAMGEFARASKRGIPIFEVKEQWWWIPIWFRKISFVKL